MAETVHVMLLAPSGPLSEFDVPASCLVSAVKDIVAQKHNVPAMCQKLLGGADVLEDDNRLLDYCEPGEAEMTLLLITSLEEAFKCLSSPTAETRTQAIRNIAGCKIADYDAVIEALCKHSPRISTVYTTGALEENEALMKAIVKCATKGDSRAVKSVKEHMTNCRNALTGKCVCLEALCRLSESDDLDVIRCVQQKSHFAFRGNHNKEAKVIALDAISKVCRERLVEILLPYLADTSPEIKQKVISFLMSGIMKLQHLSKAAAGQVMMQVALQDDGRDSREAAAPQPLNLLRMREQVNQAISKCLVDKHSGLRVAALQALGQNCRDKEAVAQVITLLSDREADVRLAAVNALARMAPRNNKAVVLALIGCLQNQCSPVGDAALQVLRHMGQAGDKEALKAMDKLRLE